jgi:hypothetical protein
MARAGEGVGHGSVPYETAKKVSKPGPHVTSLTNSSGKTYVVVREPLGDIWAIAPGSSLQLVLRRDDDIEEIEIENGIITLASWGWDLRLFHHGHEINGGSDAGPVPEEIKADEEARIADLARLTDLLTSGESLDRLVTEAILYTVGEGRYLEAREVVSRDVDDEDKRLRRAANVALNFIDGRPALTDVD